MICEYIRTPDLKYHEIKTPDLRAHTAQKVKRRAKSECSVIKLLLSERDLPHSLLLKSTVCYYFSSIQN